MCKDKAPGDGAGMVRGIVSIKRPLQIPQFASLVWEKRTITRLLYGVGFELAHQLPDR